MATERVMKIFIAWLEASNARRIASWRLTGDSNFGMLTGDSKFDIPHAHPVNERPAPVAEGQTYL